ncbi:protein Niban-like [Rhinatrema bivittatum]|uniref:protein Niban-like n=1 Tax=Rhinatrema bivittatum TaxID=194408 RepID=UPI00112E1CCA|nr:protein Niban-like [Rhinatrema bivittatum]
MGGSASSQLDEGKCSYIRGKTEALIKNFSPHYKRQYAVAFYNQIQNEVEQQRDSVSQFLKTKPPSDLAVVLYSAELAQFADDLKKWKDRYVVVKNEYAVESYESKEACQKGAEPKSKILPSGGKVVLSEEEYNVISDKNFPDPIASTEKENAQAFVVLPSVFPVYLWHPYTKHSFYCFQDEAAQKQFGAVLHDCIRHQNHDFFKKSTCDVQAFAEAVQFFRQEKGQYGSWEMEIGNEIQILSNLVMEELLPSLQTDLLPKMKGKKNDRKRAWFAIVEEAYNLVQAQVSEVFPALQEECKTLAKTLEGTIRSDMDQILTSKEFLAGKIKAMVSEPAGKCCAESIQPFLASVLEELMGPVSSGFSEVRSLFEKEIDEISQNFQQTSDTVQLQESLDQLANLPSNSVKMEPCYLRVNLLKEQLQDLKSRFKSYYIDFVVQKTQNYMQELMENAVFTFEQLLSHTIKGDSSKTAVAIEKVKTRVLKQYDYDSSTIRKKIFQEALVQITLPTLQKTMASTCKPELQKFEQFIFADYTNVIQVENIYEEILLQTLLDETMKVIQEAASLKKHNLFEDNVHLTCESVSSLTELKTPSGSAQASPAKMQSPLRVNEGPVEDVFADSEATQEEHDADEFTTGKQDAEKLPDDKEALHNGDSIVPSSITDEQESLPVKLQEKPRAEAVEEERTHPGKENREEDDEHKKMTETTQDMALGDLNEIRSLLTVTIEVPADVQHQNIEEIVKGEGIIQIEERVEEKIEKEICTEEIQADKVMREELKHSEFLSEQTCNVSLGTDSAVSQPVDGFILSDEPVVSDGMETHEQDKQKEEAEPVQSVGFIKDDICGVSAGSSIQAEEYVESIHSEPKETGHSAPHAVQASTDTADSVPDGTAEDKTTQPLDDTLPTDKVSDFAPMEHFDQLNMAQITMDTEPESVPENTEPESFPDNLGEECSPAVEEPALDAGIASSTGNADDEIAVQEIS